MRVRNCERGLLARINRIIMTADDGARGRRKTGVIMGGFRTRAEEYAMARMHATSAVSAFGRGDCRRTRISFTKALKAFRKADR